MKNHGTNYWASIAPSDVAITNDNLFQTNYWNNSAQTFRFELIDDDNTYLIHPIGHNDKYNTDNYTDAYALYCDYESVASNNVSAANVTLDESRLHKRHPEGFEWLLEKESEYTYTIRLKANPRYLLAVINDGVGSALGTGINDMGNIVVQLTPSATSTPTNKQKWELTYAIPEGIYCIQNRSTSQYLSNPQIFNERVYTDDLNWNDNQKWLVDHVHNGLYFITAHNTTGTAMSLSSSTPTENGSVYIDGNMAQPRFMWQIERLEGGSYKISNAQSNSYGQNFALKIYYHASTITSVVNGSYVANQDRNDEWYMYQLKDASLIALPEDYDRSSFFKSSLSKLANIGYTNNYSNHYLVDYGTTEAKLIERMAFSKITLIRTHGVKTSISLSPTGSDGSLTANEVLNLELDYSDLIIYGACNTAQDGLNGSNLVTATVQAGARSVIGFENIVNSSACNMWCNKFFEYYSSYYDDPSKNLLDVCIEVDTYVQENSEYYEYSFYDDNNELVYSTVKNYIIAGEISFSN